MPITTPQRLFVGYTLAVLVGSKIIMLEAINILFSDKVNFSGPLNGVVAFFAFLNTEISVSKINFALKDKPKDATDE
ncbi:hypothetical protein BIT28_06395 [Photobacterium proteolyticum]|uniref:Uncharacterized protein n=1 Tax=Photobacterium proteolyticum TaxID=1903952 RepID=A0A1Q9GEJ1_9GAMM|nr:hypothetical protein BIT28_06395 [Photobacterium proteolyticum]